MAIGSGAAMPRNVFEHRQHAASKQTFRHGRGYRCYLFWRVAIGAIADHGIAIRGRDIGQRQAVHVDAEGMQVMGDQARTEFGRSKPVGGLMTVKSAVHGAWRVDRPVGWTQPLHPAPFLIDQDWRIKSNGRSKFLN